MKILVLTLGFDERFAIRNILRTGLSTGDSVIVFIAKPIVEKTERALQILRDFIKRYYENINLEVIAIPIEDFENAVSIIGEQLKRFKDSEGEIIFNLSGGMRGLIIELLLASLLMELRGTVEVDFENLEGSISFPLEIFKVQIPMKKYRSVLKIIAESNGMNISQISNRLKIAKSSVHKIVKKLLAMKIIEVEKKGREYIIRTKPIARLFIN
ncbi:MAG: CRISPR-associated CARF protein Csa3 [Nitrososphaerota archaeon]|nr:CRISPR-associated CARF protein Csa3 [Nitrososphaerota archaeon]